MPHIGLEGGLVKGRFRLNLGGHGEQTQSCEEAKTHVFNCSPLHRPCHRSIVDACLPPTSPRQSRMLGSDHWFTHTIICIGWPGGEKLNTGPAKLAGMYSGPTGASL